MCVVNPGCFADRLIQKAFAEHLEKVLGWESAYAWNNEVFGTHQPSPRALLPVGEGIGGA